MELIFGILSVAAFLVTLYQVHEFVLTATEALND